MPVLHAPRRSEADARMLLFPLVTLLLFLALLGRLWYFQVAKAEELREKGIRYQQSAVSKLAPRGLMYDRRGKLLAGVRSELVLTGVPAVVRKNPWVLKKLAALLDMDLADLEEKVAAGAWKPYLPTPLVVGVPIGAATQIAEAADQYPGLAVETQPMRYYPDPLSFTHVLGYAWVPNKDDVERLTGMGLRPASYVGKLGVEYVYETELMGRPGADRVEVDAKRRPLRVIGRDAPTPGSKLILALDARVQAAAIRAFAGRRGGAVAIEPSTGEVICLVSSPSYDLNLFQGGISKQEYETLRTEELPQLNRAIYAAYQPGSTFKIVTTMAALRAGKFNPKEGIFCPGYFSLGAHKTRCMGRHGSIAFKEAMTRSCNTYFATLAYRAGREALQSTSLDLGLGQKTGIDLLGEGKGVILTDEWMRRWRNPPVWYSGDAVNMGIGQGETLTTPLQMAMVAALVANEGVAYKPHVVRAIAGEDGEAARLRPEPARRFKASKEFWATMKASLMNVVEAGTARRGRIPGLPWSGKTGSAEHKKGHKTHGWFVAFAPADKPKIALAVVVEAAGHGGEVAVPVAKEMVAAYLMPEPDANARNSSALASAAAPSERRPVLR